MPKKFVLIFCGLVFFLSSHTAWANVSINEVFYSPASRQWIEIYNNTDNEIDITGYKVLDSGAAVNGHSVSAIPGGSSIIPAHGYGVVAKDSTSVSATYLFKASLGMDKEGDTVILKNSGVVVDTVSFNSSVSEDQSLQLIGGSWVSATPTPGAENSSSPSDDTPDQEDTPLNSPSVSRNKSSYTAASTSSSNQSQKTIAKIVVKNISFVGLPLTFSGEALGPSGEKLYSGKYFWNFGDGDSKETQDNNSFSHTYLYPGDYAVSMEYYSGLYTQIPDVISKIKIKVVPMALSISAVGKEGDFFVELTNNSLYDMDLSGWKILYTVTPEQNFTLPRNTNILAKSKMVLSSQVTHFSKKDDQPDQGLLKLTTSGGEVIANYGAPPEVLAATLLESKQVKIENKNSTPALSTTPPKSESYISSSDLPDPSTEKIIENLPAAVSSSTSGEGSSKNVYFFTTILVIFLGLSAGAVYIIRRNSLIPQAGSDFEILDE